MTLFKKIIEILQNEKAKSKNNINGVNEEILNLSVYLEELSSIISLFDTDITLINIDKISEILLSLNNNSISSNELQELEETKKIVKFLYNPQLPNVGIKKGKLTFINDIKLKLKSIYDEIFVIIEKNNVVLNENRTYMDRLDFYLNMLKKREFQNEMSVEEFNQFFDFLEELSVPKDIIFDAVSAILVGKLRKQESLYKQETKDILSDNNIEDEIDKNGDKIIVVEEKKIDNIDLSSLTAEENELLKELEKLITENNANYSDEFLNFIREIFEGLNIEERQEFYFNNGVLDWDTIAADYNANLLPNIVYSKEEVLNIVRFIIDSNKKSKVEEFVALDKLDVEIKKFEENYQLVNEIVEQFYKNPSEFCLGFDNEDVEKINNLIVKLNMLAKNTIMNVDTRNIKGVELEVVNLRLVSLMAEFNDIVSKKSVSDDVEEYNDSYDVSKTKTLILLLKDSNGNFVPVEQIKNEVFQDKSEVLEAELCKAISMIANKGMSDNKKKSHASHVDKKSSSGDDILFKDYFGFNFDRIRFTDRGRTGYVIVPVADANRKKLVSVYGENIFYQNYNSLVLLVSSIFCSANHSEYSEFKDLIGENYYYIDYILNLFKNPDSSIDELMQVIDESAFECKKISSTYGSRGK